MLGGTQTAHAGDCSRCRHWKPPHAPWRHPLPSSWGCSREPMNRTRLLTLSSWMVRVGAFQNVYLALTLVSRRRPNMCCLSPPSSACPSRSSRQIQMEKASLWHHAGLHSGWTEEGCHATHVNLTDRTFQGKNVPGESGSCLKSNIKTSSQCKQVWCLNLNTTQQYGLSRSEKAREEDREQSSQGGVETNASMGFGCLPWNYDGFRDRQLNQPL